MNRKISFAWMAIIFCLLCTSCGKKVASTAEDRLLCTSAEKEVASADEVTMKKLKSMGFIVAESTSKYTSSTSDLQMFLLARNNTFNIDFYQYKTMATAKEAYADGVSNLEKIVEKIKKAKGNYFEADNELYSSASKELTTDDKYYYILRNDSALVYCETNVENRDSVVVIMEKIRF